MQIDSWDSYFIDGTNVLKNNLNITNKSKLEEQERLITLKKLAYLELFPVKGKFDEEHLRKIHYFLFSDIYPFAGKLRTCTMAKTTRQFYNPSDIKQYLNIELERMKSELKNISSLEYYSFF